MMCENMVEKILKEHLVEGRLIPGEEITIKIDQVLTHDMNGVIPMLQLEDLGIERIAPSLGVCYIDHQVYQIDFRHSDDQRYLREMCKRLGLYYSKAGHGICHQLHRELFSIPGETLLGTDSHTTTMGGVAMLSLGAGGLDFTKAFVEGTYTLTYPQVVSVYLTGELDRDTGGKDIILELLRRVSVKGGRGTIYEFTGPGVSTLSIPSRCTVANMAIETGATTCIFPSDERLKEYMERWGRGEYWRRIDADRGAEYQEEIHIDLSMVEPLVALPYSPDHVVPVKSIKDKRIEMEQVVIGSCTNGDVEDFKEASRILKGRSVHPKTQLILLPASKNVYLELLKEGIVEELALAGGIWSESTCGPCNGTGHVPATETSSLRTTNRNFKGRSGLEEDSIYLCGPQVAAASAITGVITHPKDLEEETPVRRREDSPDLVLCQRSDEEEIKRGPNILFIPFVQTEKKRVEGEVLLKVSHHISTDFIVPNRKETTIYRSNIASLSNFTLSRIDPTFAKRALEKGGGFIVAGENYGQGSSREHAAICPMYLGILGVFALSFARIHRSNLINYGLFPFVFACESIYEDIEEGDHLEFVGDIYNEVEEGREELSFKNSRNESLFKVLLQLSPLEKKILLSGGSLALLKKKFQA